VKRLLFISLLLLSAKESFCWGFFGHRKINYHSVFLLPPEMMVMYKPQIDFLVEHAVDPDKRRYAVENEAPRHYIDIDRYGPHAKDSIPKYWKDAVNKYSEDSLQAHGIVPWWIHSMLFRLTNAFKEKNQAQILKYSAEIGHYIADAHVPLHASSNHNGQYTDQKGIHGFWESRVPELLADKNWDFFIGKAEYITDPQDFIWKRVWESAAASDTVLLYEKELSRVFPQDQKYSFEDRNGTLIRQYSSAYTIEYDKRLKGMVERRMRQSIYAIACFWYTAWVDAGQPDLTKLTGKELSAEDISEFEKLNDAWRNKEVGERDH
jgi:hypothetical protein